MKKALKIILWIIAFLLFPIAAGLYFIWPSRIWKSRISKGWKIFWWTAYALLTVPLVSLKILLCFVFIILCGGEQQPPIISREDVPASYYRTSEDFYKLTGVEFPELEMVDSLYYDENTFRANRWSEYKFVVKSGAKNSFYRRLNRACKVDSTHWRYDEEDDTYRYGINPDQHPVDRSRGMCDRMITIDGSIVEDRDGDFISVKIQIDTVVLREGWIR